jgi:hypothetical protein
MPLQRPALNSCLRLVGSICAHPWSYFQAKNRQRTGSRALPRRVEATFGDRCFLPRQNLTEGAGNFLPGVPLECLATGVTFEAPA